MGSAPRATSFLSIFSIYSTFLGEIKALSRRRKGIPRANEWVNAAAWNLIQNQYQRWCQNRVCSVPGSRLRRKELPELVRHPVPVLGVGRGLLFDSNIRPGLRVLGVQLQPFLKSRLGVRLDGLGRAFRLAYTTVYAFVRMNDEHVFTLVEAIHRTYLHAVHVFAFDTVFDDDVGHPRPGRSSLQICCN